MAKERPIIPLAQMLWDRGVGKDCPPYTFADQLLRIKAKKDILARLDMEPSLDNLDKIIILKRVKELQKEL